MPKPKQKSDAAWEKLERAARRLMRHTEELMKVYERLLEENERLREENRILKGEPSDETEGSDLDQELQRLESVLTSLKESVGD